MLCHCHGFLPRNTLIADSADRVGSGGEDPRSPGAKLPHTILSKDQKAVSYGNRLVYILCSWDNDAAPISINRVSYAFIRRICLLIAFTILRCLLNDLTEVDSIGEVGGLNSGIEHTPGPEGHNFGAIASGRRISSWGINTT